MDVVLTRPVEIALRPLGVEERRNVFAWLDHLKNWEGDSFVRAQSHRLATREDVYVLRTGTDIRIFFELHAGRIIGLDVATKTTLVRSGQAQGPAQ